MSRLHSHAFKACLRPLSRQYQSSLAPIRPSLLSTTPFFKQNNLQFSTSPNFKFEESGSGGQGGHSGNGTGGGTGGNAGRADGTAWSSKKVTLLCISLCGITGFAGYSLDSWKRGDYHGGNNYFAHGGPMEGVINGNMPKGCPTYGSPDEMEAAIDEIRELLGEDFVSTDDEVLHIHGFSEWSTVNSERLPVAVVYPSNTKDVAEIVKICSKYRVPMIPFSGGSSLEGHFSAPHGGISIDFTHMDKVVAFHESDMDIVVQPAVSWMDLNEQIKESGLFFPIDPGPSARIGGMVATNCSGTNAVRYGTMKDWVINLTVVLADGTIIKTRRRPRKSSAGYNLTGLFVGSEGTLGLVTEITLKLAVIPEETSVAVVTFPSIRDAAEAASSIMRKGVQVAAMELMDDVQMRVVNKAGATGRVWEEKPTLFFKFSGSKASVKQDITTVQSLAKLHHSSTFTFATTPSEQHSLWSARKQSLWSMLSLRTEGQDVWSTDVAVPLSRLADLVEISKKEMDELGMFASILGHVGDGNFHESIMWDKRNEADRVKIEGVVGRMVERALEMEGTCSGEHGVGMGKKGSLVKELGEETMGVMRLVKKALDPNWLLNPGKIVDPIVGMPKLR